MGNIFVWLLAKVQNHTDRVFKLNTKDIGNNVVLHYFLKTCQINKTAYSMDLLLLNFDAQIRVRGLFTRGESTAYRHQLYYLTSLAHSNKGHLIVLLLNFVWNSVFTEFNYHLVVKFIIFPLEILLKVTFTIHIEDIQVNVLSVFPLANIGIKKIRATLRAKTS